MLRGNIHLPAWMRGEFIVVLPFLQIDGRLSVVKVPALLSSKQSRTFTHVCHYKVRSDRIVANFVHCVMLRHCRNVHNNKDHNLYTGNATWPFLSKNNSFLICANLTVIVHSLQLLGWQSKQLPCWHHDHFCSRNKWKLNYTLCFNGA